MVKYMVKFMTPNMQEGYMINDDLLWNVQRHYTYSSLCLLIITIGSLSGNCTISKRFVCMCKRLQTHHPALLLASIQH